MPYDIIKSFLCSSTLDFKWKKKKKKKKKLDFKSNFKKITGKLKFLLKNKCLLSIISSETTCSSIVSMYHQRFE